MSTYLVIKDNTVINTVVWDGESDWTAPEGTTTLLRLRQTLTRSAHEPNSLRLV